MRLLQRQMLTWFAHLRRTRMSKAAWASAAFVTKAAHVPGFCISPTCTEQMSGITFSALKFLPALQDSLPFFDNQVSVTLSAGTTRSTPRSVDQSSPLISLWNHLLNIWYRLFNIHYACMCILHHLAAQHPERVSLNADLNTARRCYGLIAILTGCRLSELTCTLEFKQQISSMTL